MRTLLRKIGQIGWSFPILAALAFLCVTSIFIIKSATVSNPALKDAYASQSHYILIGFAVYFILALVPYRYLVLGRVPPLLYLGCVILLLACFVPHIGKKVFGAYSWIRVAGFGFEPAEYAKLAYILCLAWFLRKRENEIKSIWTVLMAVAITFVPFFLIKMQPAFGSASVFFPICFAMLFAAGARLRYIVVPLAVVLSLTVLTYYWVHVWNKPVPFLKPFQVDRIKVFFDPSLDHKDKGWQVDQSMIAIGSGGMYGKVPLDVNGVEAILTGTDRETWGQFTLTAMGFLPKNTSYNDLIFSVVGEMLGFRGGSALIICEGTVLLWCLFVAACARDKVGSLIAVGVMAMLFTHIFVNIGMTIQLVPITGIPLPFFSYGGTFLVACLAAMGLVQSVWVHRIKFERR